MMLQDYDGGSASGAGAGRRRGSMARGILSAEEAQAAAVLDHHRKTVETFDLERRIAAIEATRQPLIIRHINARA